MARTRNAAVPDREIGLNAPERPSGCGPLAIADLDGLTVAWGLVYSLPKPTRTLEFGVLKLPGSSRQVQR
jgi:hypothetical protein